MNNVEIKVIVNGKARKATVPARLLLSDFIRQDLTLPNTASRAVVKADGWEPHQPLCGRLKTRFNASASRSTACRFRRR